MREVPLYLSGKDLFDGPGLLAQLSPELVLLPLHVLQEYVPRWCRVEG